MIIKQLLEVHIVMWKQRCNLIAQTNEQTYEGRQRQKLLALCMYLKSNQDIIFDRDLNYIQRTDDFLTKSPIDNLLMWKRQIEARITRKDPATTIRPPPSENTINPFNTKHSSQSDWFEQIIT